MGRVAPFAALSAAKSAATAALLGVLVSGGTASCSSASIVLNTRSCPWPSDSIAMVDEGLCSSSGLTSSVT